MTQIGEPQLVANKRRVARGTIDPNAGTRRLLPLPKQIPSDSPNVCTVSTPNESASTISDSVFLLPIPQDPRLRRLSPPQVQAAGSFFNANSTIPLLGSGSPAVVTCGAQVWDFMFDGSAFEVVFRDQGPDGTGLRVMVDDEWVDEDGMGVSFVWPNSGSYYYVKHTFADRRPRHVTIELSGQYFHGVKIGPKDSAWLPTDPTGPVVGFIGDSFTEGARLVRKADVFGFWCGRALGWKRVFCSGRGGTGYLNTLPSQGYPKYRDRLNADIFPHDPDIVVVCGGINDQAFFTKQEIYDEAALLYQAIRDGLPGALVFATGPWSPTGHPTGVTGGKAGFMNTNDAIREACDLMDVPYLDTIGGPYPYDGNVAHYYDTGWITGTGTVQTPTASGNANYYIGTTGTVDETHPSPEGHRFLGLRIASGLVGFYPL